MKSLSLILAAAASVQSTPAERPSFQAYGLGLSLSEARNIPITSGTSPIFVCEGEENANRFLQSSPSDKRAGVKLCYPTSVIGSSRVFQDLRISDEINGHGEFRFFDEKLFQIEVWTDATASTTILDALTRKFGNPKIAVAAIQNAYGAKWQQSIYRWNVGSDLIEMKTPETAILRMSVTYTDTKAHDEVLKKKSAIDAKTVKM